MELTSSLLSCEWFLFLIAVVATCICCVVALFTLRYSSRSSSSSSSIDKEGNWCNGVVDSTRVGEKGGVVVRENRHHHYSMMEQLVPEITTHALSYLDYPSLCRLSMTNSLMRMAANDDTPWKSLFHKDFSVEQDSVRPANGWKAYYAATRAVVNINAEFFNIIRERSRPAMGRFWLSADYVKCIHASGELFSGYDAVMESWGIIFNWDQQADGLEVHDVRSRVLSEMAWVSMKVYVDADGGAYNMTNVFEYHNGRWYMVHHHCSMLLLMDGDGMNQAIVHG